MSFKPGDVITVSNSKRKSVVLAYHEVSDTYPLATLNYMNSTGWLGSMIAGAAKKTGEFIEPMHIENAKKSPDIHVGDEIQWSWAGISRVGFVTRQTNNGLVEIFDHRHGCNGILFLGEPAFQHCAKTGRHADISRIRKLLESLQEENDG